MNPVTWFEIPTRDIARAKAFYESVFEVELIHMDMGPDVMEAFPWTDNGAGSAGTLIQADGYTPSQEGSVVYFGVKDIDSTLGKVNSAGGQTLMPRMDIGEHGSVAQFLDCEGNRIALHTPA